MPKEMQEWKRVFRDIKTLNIVSSIVRLLARSTLYAGVYTFFFLKSELVRVSLFRFM